MSPELALAQRAVVDHRTDIYSLGTTLYELMTLEPVFGGHDRRELLRRIAFEEPRPPRRINADIPQELETIVLKAMAKNPEERYAAAQELADDLRRFLDDKPIRAKRPTLMHRLRKMARRHRPVVWTVGVSIAIVMAISIIGLAASNVWISRERDAKGKALREKANALTEATAQRQAAEQARAEAIANLKTARQAVDQMLTRVGEQQLADIPQMEQVRRQLLEDAIGFYQSFHQEYLADPEIRLETALAQGRLGNIYSMLGQRVQAEQALRDGIGKLEALHDESPIDADARESLSNFHSALAANLCGLKRHDECVEESRRAVAEAEELAADHPNVRRTHRLGCAYAELGAYLCFDRPAEAEDLFRRAITLTATHADHLALAQVQSHLGASLINAGRWTDGEGPLSQALDIWKRLAIEQPASVRFRGQLANTFANRGIVFERIGRFSDAEMDYREACAIGEKLATEFPTVPGHRASVAWLHRSLGNLLRGRDPARAADHFVQALAGYERLVADFPTMPEYDENLSRHSYRDTGLVLAAIGRAQEAAEVLGRAISIQQSVGQELSNKLTYWRDMAVSHVELGRVLADTGRTVEADGEFRKAVAIAEKLETDFGGKPDYREDLAATQQVIGHLLGRSVRPADAISVYRLAVEHYQKLVSDGPDVARHRWWLAVCHRRIGMSRASLDQPREAEAAYREAIAHGADGCATWAHLAATQLALSDMDGYRKTCARLLDGYGRNEHWNDANTVAWFCLLAPISGVDITKVVQVAEQALTRDDPYSKSYRHDALNTLGVALYRAGRFKESIARLEEAIAAHAKGGNPWDWLFMAMAHARLGQPADAHKWYDRSVEWLEQNRTTLEKHKTQGEELRRFRAEADDLIKK